MYPPGFAVARKQSWYSQWKMSSSFMPLIVSNDDGFYILSMESMLWKKLDYAKLCTCVFVYCGHWSDQKSNEGSQSLIIFPAHPRTSLFFCGFFPLLIRVMILPKLAAENTVYNTVGKHTGKPLQDQVRWQRDKCHQEPVRCCHSQEDKTKGIWGISSLPCSCGIPEICYSLFLYSLWTII